MINKEANLENDDKLYNFIINRRNEIENIIYSTRIKMNDELSPFLTEEERTVLPPLMDAVETWFYSGDEAVYNKTELEKNTEKFNEVSGKIYARFNNWRNLDDAVEFLKKYNANNANKISQAVDSHLKNYIKQDELFNLVSNSNKQLGDLEDLMQKTPRFMDCPFSAEKLRKEFDELNNVKNCFKFLET